MRTEREREREREREGEKGGKYHRRRKFSAELYLAILAVHCQPAIIKPVKNFPYAHAQNVSATLPSNGSWFGKMSILRYFSCETALPGLRPPENTAGLHSKEVLTANRRIEQYFHGEEEPTKRGEYNVWKETE